MGKRLEANALSSIVLAESCQIDIGDSVTSIDSSNYNTAITWGVNHTNPLVEDAEFRGQKYEILDATDYTVSYKSNYVIANFFTEKAINGKLILNHFIPNNGGTKVTYYSNTIYTAEQELRKSITEVFIPYGTTGLGNGLFSYTNITNVDEPDTVITHTNNTYYNCAKLKNVKLSSNLDSIKNYDFYGCEALKTITLPESITQIYESAFRSSGLTEITIPAGVTTIASNAFYGCTNLATITVNNKADVIAGAPWGAPNATVVYTAE